MEIYSKHCQSQTGRARELKLWENIHPTLCVMCHVSCVMCHLSCAMCHLSPVTCPNYVEGLLSMGPTPSSLWKEWLTQWMNELITRLLVGQPRLHRVCQKPSTMYKTVYCTVFKTMYIRQRRSQLCQPLWLLFIVYSNMNNTVWIIGYRTIYSILYSILL